MKKYLKTEEEVITALKSGKIVYLEDYPHHHYKMIDGIICGKFNDNPYVVGCSVDLLDKMYILDDNFTIEVGNFYKTRNGGKAFCYYIAQDEECFFVMQNLINPFSTDILGKWKYIARFDREELEYDIVGYWEDEK